MQPPPVPAHLAHLALVRGYAAPWISSHHLDGSAVLGVVDGSRVRFAFQERLCQLCAKSLDRETCDGRASRIVALARPQDFAERVITEPGMHPECAAYTLAACPMLNGSMARYRASRPPVTCTHPDCVCHDRGNEIQSPEGRRGAPSDPWYSLWLSADKYNPALVAGSPHLVLPLAGVTFLAVRPVKATGATDDFARTIRATSAMVALLGAMGG